MKKNYFILCSFFVLLCTLQFTIIVGDLSFLSGSKTSHQPRTLKHSPLTGPNPIWNRTFGGIGDEEGWDIIECSDGGYAIAGQSSSFGAGDMDLWVIRLNSNGDQVWAYTYGGTDHEESYGDIVQCSDAGFIVGAHTRSFGAGSNDIWVLRIDSTGQHMWNQTYGGVNAEYCGGIIPCSGGGFAISGTTYSFGLGVSDVWLIRIDDAGNHLWNHTYGGASSEYGSSVVECTDGGFALTVLLMIPALIMMLC
jgi:predicted secreted protein